MLRIFAFSDFDRFFFLAAVKQMAAIALRCHSWLTIGREVSALLWQEQLVLQVTKSETQQGVCICKTQQSYHHQSAFFVFYAVRGFCFPFSQAQYILAQSTEAVLFWTTPAISQQLLPACLNTSSSCSRVGAAGIDCCCRWIMLLEIRGRW